MSNTPAYRVLIVDDHPLMRRGLGQLLELETGFELVGEASNGYQALDAASEHEPDLILLDLNMKGLSGLDTLHALREQNSQAIVVILTVSDNPSDIRALIKAGADGYLLKDTEPEQLLVLLHQAVAASRYSAIKSVSIWQTAPTRRSTQYINRQRERNPPSGRSG